MTPGPADPALTAQDGPAPQIGNDPAIVRGSEAGPTTPTIYLLIGPPQPGHRVGWTLEAWHGSRQAPPVSLGDWGAAIGAAPSAAQAAARRALAEQGIAVHAWWPCGDALGPMYLTRPHPLDPDRHV